jgi:hypothetical protein
MHFFISKTPKMSVWVNSGPEFRTRDCPETTRVRAVRLRSLDRGKMRTTAVPPHAQARLHDAQRPPSPQSHARRAALAGGGGGGGGVLRGGGGGALRQLEAVAAGDGGGGGSGGGVAIAPAIVAGAAACAAAARRAAQRPDLRENDPPGSARGPDARSNEGVGSERACTPLHRPLTVPDGTLVHPTCGDGRCGRPHPQVG